MKRILALVLSLLLLICVAGCSQNSGEAEISDKKMLELAREAAQWIADNPGADAANVQEMCETLGVDEVCFVDATGVIAVSNDAEVVGYDMNSDEQSKAFLPLLSGEITELVQEPAPRGFDGTTWRWAAVSGGLEGGLTQVGIKVE